MKDPLREEIIGYLLTNQEKFYRLAFSYVITRMPRSMLYKMRLSKLWNITTPFETSNT